MRCHRCSARSPAITLGAVSLLAAVAWGGRAGAASGRVEKVVASLDRLAVLGDRRIAIFDGHGNPLRRCAIFEGAPLRASRARAGALDPDEALALAGLPDDDDSLDAEDALEEEGLGPERRRRSPSDAPPLPRDLAAAPLDDQIWIAASDGLYRASDRGCARVALAGRDLVLAGAAPGVVSAASDTLLWRFDPEKASSTVAAGLPFRPRALAVAEGGRIVVGDEDGVLEAAPGLAPRRLLDRPTDALAACEGELIALADDGVYVEQDGAFARVTDRPPVRSLACGARPGPRFLAAGVGLWTSSDGIVWSENAGALGRSVSHAAATASLLFLAVEGELVVVDPSAPIIAEAQGVLPASGLSPRSRLVTPILAWPRLSVAFASEQTPTRAGWSVLLLLSFPLGRRGAIGPPPAELADQVARRNASLAAEQIRVAAQASNGEASAWARVLEQERAALP